MNRHMKQALANYLIAMGDDELILGQRDGEWCGHAPILEEDIAFANIALDEIGHANVWYQLAAELLDEDPGNYPDWLAFQREAAEFRNVQMVATPNGDWAFSMLRQYLFDSFETMRLEGLLSSEHKPLAEAAAKIRSEEIYHRRHTEAWVRRLALGTQESKTRMQSALYELWGFAMQLGEGMAGDADLVKGRFIPDSNELRIAWTEDLGKLFGEIELVLPQVKRDEVINRGEHAEQFADFISEMQEVPRQFPEGVW